MSRLIASLLGRPEHEVSKTIALLEAKNGYPSHDVRHLADSIQKTRTKISELGLDPNDTTSEELYYALLIKFQKDSQYFDAQQAVAGEGFAAKADKAIKITNTSFDLPERWILKSSAMKQLLKASPPKHTMKRLNYRSVSSLIKRQPIRELYLTASLLEPKAWQKSLQKDVAKLDSSNFELGSISLACLAKDKRHGFISDELVLYNDDAGCLAIIENQISSKMSLLSLVIVLIDSLSELIDYNLSKEVTKLSPVLAWWSDMDGLISSLNSEQVSLNIKDVSTNHDLAKHYADRTMEYSRSSFWHELIKRYDNQLKLDEDKLADLKDHLITANAPLNQPVFEYAEDI